MNLIFLLLYISFSLKHTKCKIMRVQVLNNLENFNGCHSWLKTLQKVQFKEATQFLKKRLKSTHFTNNSIICTVFQPLNWLCTYVINCVIISIFHPTVIIIVVKLSVRRRDDRIVLGIKVWKFLRFGFWFFNLKIFSHLIQCTVWAVKKIKL